MTRRALHFWLGLGLVGLLLGSGLLVSLLLIRLESAQISQADFTQLTQTVNQLATSYNQETTNPETISESSGQTTIQTVRINHADQTELETLVGIGPARAQAILDARAAGPFIDIDDIRARVPKVPRSVLEQIASNITFD